jgi:putative polyhydroxyalkanoate system protein
VAHISIRRAHHSTTAEAKKMAEKIAAKLEKDYDLKSSWQRDVLTFTRSGINGTLAVTVKELHIEVKLGLLMAAFKGPIQGAIEKKLDALIKPEKPEVAQVTATPAARKSVKK